MKEAATSSLPQLRLSQRRPLGDTEPQQQGRVEADDAWCARAGCVLWPRARRRRISRLKGRGLRGVTASTLAACVATAL